MRVGLKGGLFKTVFLMAGLLVATTVFAEEKECVEPPEESYLNDLPDASITFEKNVWTITSLTHRDLQPGEIELYSFARKVLKNDNLVQLTDKFRRDGEFFYLTVTHKTLTDLTLVFRQEKAAADSDRPGEDLPKVSHLKKRFPGVKICIADAAIGSRKRGNAKKTDESKVATDVKMPKRAPSKGLNGSGHSGGEGKGEHDVRID